MSTQKRSLKFKKNICSGLGEVHVEIISVPLHNDIHVMTHSRYTCYIQLNVPVKTASTLAKI